MMELHHLIRLYLIGNITIDVFQNVFVKEFLTTSIPDQDTESAVIAVESNFNDLSAGRISESVFRSRVVQILPVPLMTFLDPIRADILSEMSSGQPLVQNDGTKNESLIDMKLSVSPAA
jgi:hypothetical protein